MSQNISDPNSIERDLDQTRSRLGSHLSELQNRFSPGQVLDDAMAYLRGSEGADFGRSLLGNVRDNPMPAVITAIGLAWLMASKNTGSQAPSGSVMNQLGKPQPHVYGHDDYHATMARVRDAENTVSRDPSETEHTYSARLDETRGQAIGLARHTQETAQSFSQRVGAALSAMQAAVSHSGHDLRDKVGAAASATGDSASAAGASARGMAQNAVSSLSGALSQGGHTGGSFVASLGESPVLTGVLGLAAGALLGALLPRTDQEEAMLGGIASQARDAVTGFASDGLERGKQVAQAAMDKGRDSAQAHGLAGGRSAGELLDAALGGNLAADAKAVAQDVLQTGDDAVRKATATGDGASPNTTQ